MARIIDAGSAAVTYECVPRPTCPGCGAEWDDETVALFDLALGLGCACCNPFAGELPDITCHQCDKVLFSARGPVEGATQPDAPTRELDLSPRD